MTEADRAFTGSIPELYDRYLGPMLFEPYAEELAARFSNFSGEILETAAGTGRVTRALLRALAPASHVTATDLNEPMLKKAAEEIQSVQVRWQQADAQDLPFADGQFDAVVCQFGVMFFPDKLKAFREARRVLRPGGRFVFSVWNDLEQNEISHIADQVVAECFPSNPPGFLKRGPFGYHDQSIIGATLRDAGFRDVAFDVVTIPTRAPSAIDAAIGLCKGTPLRNELEERDASRLDAIADRVAAALRKAFGDGSITGKGQALVVTALN
jgi:ubiquinone/menaquinone biosynthesis C-methylase UbiE